MKKRLAVAATGVVATSLALASVAWACGPLGVAPRYSFTYEITKGAYTANPTTYNPLATGTKSTGFTIRVDGFLNIPPNEGGARGNDDFWLGNVAATAADLPEGYWNKCNPLVGNHVGDLAATAQPLNKYTIQGVVEITNAEIGTRTSGTTYMMCSMERMETWKALITIV